jgi:hypothetical protein
MTHNDNNAGIPRDDIDDIDDIGDDTQNHELRSLLLDARASELDAREQTLAEILAQRARDAHAVLAAEIEAQCAEQAHRIAEERTQRLDLLDKEIRGMRERAAQDLARLRETEEAEARRVRERQQAALSEERERHDAALRQERERMRAEEEQMARALAAREELVAEGARQQHLQQMQLDRLQRELVQKDANAERLAEQRVRWAEDAAQARQAGLESELRRAVGQVAELEANLRRLDEVEVRFGDSAEALLQRLEAAERKAAQLQDELLARPSIEERIELHALREEKLGWAQQLERQGFETAKLAAQQSRWLTSVADIEHQKQLVEIGNRHLEALEVRLQTYGAEVDRLKELQGKPAQRETRMAALTAPQIRDFTPSPPKQQPSEQAWLEQISRGCESLGMHFPRRLLYAFHTSLKCAESSPLTVLAGVSGTGKSALPRLYSRLGGVAFLHLPVQPNWDSPQSLFGYYNPLDSRFHATPLLRALVQAQQDRKANPHGLADHMLIVLLDEMNLAHVELYFSDLLSRLEARRDEQVSQPIDLGADVESFELALGDNLLWVGTMNEDETTKTLSDKVVDRANTLYFPRPRKLHSRAGIQLPPPAPLLQAQTWRGWQARNGGLPAEYIERFRESLDGINQHLEHAGRALGHRVWQAAESYMANHPDVLAAQRAGNQFELERALQLAFEDQLVLKVMPKLRGIEASGAARTQCLDPIRKLLSQPDLGLSLGPDFDAACDSAYGVFAWNSAHYLSQESA